MGCSHSSVLALGYVPSWKSVKSKATPKILDNPDTFSKMVKEWIDEKKAKKKVKGKVKAW